jgi:TadE-like protein
MPIVMPARVRTGRRSACGGGAAVEFALILPLFLAVLFGIIDYGWYFYQRYALDAAIREGIRYGVTFASPSAWTKAQTRATTYLSATGSPVNPASITWLPISPTNPISGANPTWVLTFGAQLAFKPLVGFVPLPTLVKYQMVMLLEIQPP